MYAWLWGLGGHKEGGGPGLAVLQPFLLSAVSHSPVCEMGTAGSAQDICGSKGSAQTRPSLGVWCVW